MKVLISLFLVALTIISMPPALAKDVEKELTDPTRPNWFGLKKKYSANRLVLNSLVMSPQRRIAVINGELMREGDSKRGITVEQILADRVLVSTKNGSKQALKLPNSSDKANNQTTTSAARAKGTTR